MAYISQLGDSADVLSVGGKAANLGAMLTAGFPVPDGFVITTAAYREAIDASGLSGADAATLRLSIPRMPIPRRIADSVRMAYSAFGKAAVAVRSSGVAEDAAGASFAGQYRTYLNVRGADDVLAAVRACWASLWEPRGVSYRAARQATSESDPAIAVVIEQMVDAEYAGVLFTADPVSGRRDKLVIEAVEGLGEPLVSGERSGIRCVVDRETLTLVDGVPAIPSSALTELAALGARAERLFGAPQDIEWAYSNSRVALVQSRPLTALPDAPTAASPATESASKASKGAASRKRGPGPFAVTADHMPYPPFPIDVELLFRPAANWIVRHLQAAGLAVPGDVLREIADGVVQIAPPRMTPTLRAVTGIPRAVPKILRLIRTDRMAWQKSADETVIAEAKRLDARDAADMSDADLRAHVRELIASIGALMPSRFGAVAPGMAAEKFAHVLLIAAVGPARARRLRAELLANLDCVTSAANADLARMAATVRSTPELSDAYRPQDRAGIAARLRESTAGRGLLGDVDQHLRRYGFRAVTMFTLGMPTLRESPWIVHGFLKDLAGAGERTGRGDRYVQASDELAAARGARARLLVPAVMRLSGSARAGTAFREDSHYALEIVLAVARGLLLELGRRLASRGVLADAGDIAYVGLTELETLPAGAVRPVVDKRKAARAAALDGYTVIPTRSGGIPSPKVVPGPAGVHGTPASRGTATGTVRVVHDETEFSRLRPGDVLVCQYTNPTWTPLFSIACAVVADSGSAASHAAIVARERGIPAVMGTGDGTRSLPDGIRVLVDADHGVVTPIAAPPTP